jgi:hypothetical protein
VPDALRETVRLAPGIFNPADLYPDLYPPRDYPGLTSLIRQTCRPSGKRQ